MKAHYDIVVLGAGPAGMTAATIATGHGADVLLLDEQPGPGGQIYRSVTRSPLLDGDVLGADYRQGRDLVAGIPKVVVTTSDEIREALVEPIGQIVETVHLTLERTPPELAADIVDRGIMLVGGGSLLTDLDQVLRQETKLPILRSEDPFTAVVHGAGRALDNLDLLREVAIT